MLPQRNIQTNPLKAKGMLKVKKVILEFRVLKVTKVIQVSLVKTLKSLSAQ